jgi:O-antigen ligase
MMMPWRTLLQDWFEATPVLRSIVYTRHRWMLVLALLLILLVVGLTGGWGIAEFGALPAVALILAFGYAVWALFDLEVAYLGVFGVLTLLPFGSLPFDIGFTPTFLDLALGGLFAVWLLPYALGEQEEVIATPVGAPILAFALLAVVAFIAGLAHGSLTSYLIRHFAEVLLSIATFFLVVNTVRSGGRLRRLLRWFILGAFLASTLGIVLYLLPEELTIRVLSSLRRFGYPTGTTVVRYIRDDPTLMKRATSTSVDPNVLGSLLNVAVAIAIPQLLSERPILPKWILSGMIGVMGLGLVLTVSRSAMVGVGLAVLAISLMRYRQLLPWFVLAFVILLVLPWTQGIVEHFIEGVQRQDLSTKMRLGEYKDTITLIRRYPFLGVGFAGAPDIDIYVAVASLYLIVAAQMGLVGLASFLAVIGFVLWRFWRYHRQVRQMPDLEASFYGLHAAIIGGIVSGAFDHFFFSLDFHHSVTLFWLLIGFSTAASELVIRRSRLTADV